MKHFALLSIFTVHTFFIFANNTACSSESSSESKCSPEQLQSCLSEGKILYKTGNHSDALNLFKVACDGGEMLGCGGQGASEYRLGNKAEAIKLLSRACDGKEINSCVVLKSITEHKQAESNLSAETKTRKVGRAIASVSSQSIVGKWQEEGTGTIYNFEKDKFIMEGGPPGFVVPYSISQDGILSFTIMGQKVESLVSSHPQSTTLQKT